MTDLQYLFIIVLLFHFIEAIFILPKGSTSFKGILFSSKSKFSNFNSALRVKKGWLSFSSPLPPFGKFFVINELPVTLTENGLFFISGKDYSFIPYSTIKTTDLKQATLRINGTISIKCCDLTQAKLIEQLLKSAISGGNKQFNTFMKNRYNLKKIQKTLENYYEKTSFIRFICTFLFLFIFIFSPAMVFLFSFEACGLTLLVEILAMVTIISISYYRTHLSLFKLQKNERNSTLLKNLLCPINSIGCANLLSKQVLEEFSPVAVTHELCDQDTFMEFARKSFHKTKSLNNKLRNDVTGDLLEYKQLLHFLERNNISLEKLSNLTMKVSTDTKSYCPSCQGQYTLEKGICSDCFGIELIRINYK